MIFSSVSAAFKEYAATSAWKAAGNAGAPDSGSRMIFPDALTAFREYATASTGTAADGFYSLEKFLAEATRPEVDHIV